MVNGSGSTFFSGSKGGHFKSLLIDGGGQQIFNITGSGAESVVGYSVLVRNASSLGILSNLYAVFFEVLQVVSTNGGLQASNVTSFFMDKVFWTDSNTGTFLKLSGTFGNLQIANGRAVVDTGETGIDVSANPTITVSASLTSLNFTGTGTIIKKYTTGTYIGYNFTNKWDIDSPGILLEKDAAATGNLYLTTIVDTDITAVNTPKKIAGTTAGLNLFRTSSPANNRLAYLGNKTRYVTYTGSMSASTGINNKVFNFYVAKNGAILIESKQSRKIANANDVGSISISGVVQLSTGDYLELWVENTTDATDITIEAMNFVIR